MDAQTLKAILNKADPNKNSSVHERQSALRMAEREMDRNGWSFASLGFSQEDAERIANQFSVAVGGGQRAERTSLNLFSKKPVRENTGIQKRDQKTVHIPTTRSTPEKQEPYESMTDRWEREAQEKWDQQYDNWAKWRADEDAKEAEEKAAVDKVMPYLIAFAILLIVLILSFAFIAPRAM